MSALMEHFQMELAVISQKIALASSGGRHMLLERPYPAIAIPGNYFEQDGYSHKNYHLVALLLTDI